jgi:allantoicase
MTSFTDLIDLASERLGGAVVTANDEFFAPKEALLKPGAPEWREGVYTERGKWMDGWETRRRRSAGHDWAIIKLGIPGQLRQVEVDTSHFKGNFPESCSLEAGKSASSMEQINWTPLLERTKLQAHTRHQFEEAVLDAGPFSFVRLNIYPDGGISRLHVYGNLE